MNKPVFDMVKPIEPTQPKEFNYNKIESNDIFENFDHIESFIRFLKSKYPNAKNIRFESCYDYSYDEDGEEHSDADDFICFSTPNLNYQEELEQYTKDIAKYELALEEYRKAKQKFIQEEIEYQKYQKQKEAEKHRQQRKINAYQNAIDYIKKNPDFDQAIVDKIISSADK
jgi:hypothetical protein